MTLLSSLILPGILKFYKCKGGAPPVLQIYEDNLAVLVEQVLNVLAPDVRGEVTHVDPALVA